VEDENLLSGRRSADKAALNTQKVTCNTFREGANKKIENWTNAQLKTTLNAIPNEGMKVRTVACTFGIPPTSIKYHLYGKVLGRKRGPNQF